MPVAMLDVVTQVAADRGLARMRTPALREQAIRSPFESAPHEAREHFAVQADYSCSVDAAMFVTCTPEEEIH